MSSEKLLKRTLDLDESRTPSTVWKDYRDSLSKKSSDVLNNVLTFNKGHDVSTAE